jgi:large subunit ribosomal protein L25
MDFSTPRLVAGGVASNQELSMKFELDARKRTLQGSGASRRLRREKRVPAIVYGGSAAPLLIDLDHNEILLNLRKEAFHSPC